MDLPQRASDWNYQHIEQLVKLRKEEDQYLEYKRELREDRGKLEDIACGFANASGGFILFGLEQVRDGQQLRELSPIGIQDERDLDIRIAECVKNSVPSVSTRLQRVPIPVLEQRANIVLVVQIMEAVTKPVMTSRSRFTLRIQSATLPMPYEFLRNSFVSTYLKRFSWEKLLFVLRELSEACKQRDSLLNSYTRPPFELFDHQALRVALAENYELVSTDDTQRIVENIIRKMREVQSLERSLELDATTGELERIGRRNYFRSCNQNLYHALDLLKGYVESLQGIIQSQEKR